jgi:hypothetical protein
MGGVNSLPGHERLGQGRRLGERLQPRALLAQGPAAHADRAWARSASRPERDPRVRDIGSHLVDRPIRGAAGARFNGAIATLTATGRSV